jgi:signal transduction histidine kinase
MPLFALSQRISRLEQLTAADLFDAPAERVIAQGRLVLSAFALLAVQIEPTEPALYATVVNYLVLTYLLIAVALVVLTRRIPPPFTPLLIHVVDISLVSILLVLSDAPSSPFFAFFTFILLASALRWGSRSVLTTAVILVIVLGVTSILEYEAIPSPLSPNYFDLNRILIRGASLIVIAGMLAYVTAYREHHRIRLAKLAEWPAEAANAQRSPVLQQILAHAAAVLGVSHLLVLWEEAEEPYIFSAWWRTDGYEEIREFANSAIDAVHPELADVSFATENAASGFFLGPQGRSQVTGPAVNPFIQKKFGIRNVVTAPVRGTLCKGRLFILDPIRWSDDDLTLAEIIASRTGVEIDRQVLQREHDLAVAARERARLTRDLHDTLLQNLTAAALQLQLAKRESGESSDHRFRLVERLLQQEQRRVREFVETISPKPNAIRERILMHDLHSQAKELAEQWNCSVSFSVIPDDASLPPYLWEGLSLILAEAIANAARHGSASIIEVTTESRHGELLIKIRDNGSGFPDQRGSHLEGSHSASAPASLGGRIRELGGSLVASTSDTGTELDIRIPLR